MKNPNITLPLVYNTHTLQLRPLLSQILLLPRFCLSLLLYVFFLPSLLGDYWVRRCAAVWSRAGWR